MIEPKVIEGSDNYAVFINNSGNAVDGALIESGMSMITNHEVIDGGSVLVSELTTILTDYAINHAADKGISGDLMIADGIRSIASNESVEKLVSEGKTIITVSP